jgi:type IV pilus assembly protein PilW
LIISLILLAGVLTIMSSSKRTYLLQDELGQLQENARFVIDDLTYNLRMAGYFGCANQPPVGIVVTTPITGEDNQIIRDAQRNGDGFYLVAQGGGIPVEKKQPRSDILEISTFGAPIEICGPSGIDDDNDNTTPPVVEIPLSSPTIPNVPPNAKVGDTVVLSDCGGARAFNIVGRVDDTLTLAAPLPRAFRCPIDLFNPATTVRYEVRAIDKNDDGDAVDPQDGFALFRTDSEDSNNPPRMRLFVDGVQSLQVRLGIDIDRDEVADQYVTLDSVAGRPVVSVRVNLLMRTPNYQNTLQTITNATSYEFALDPAAGMIYRPMATNLTNEMGFRHRLFSTTINVRN